MRTFTITPVSHNLQVECNGGIKNYIASIQDKHTPELSSPHILVFAGDNGIDYKEPFSESINEYLMRDNTLSKFCKIAGIKLKIIDTGLLHTPKAHPDLVVTKTQKGTNDFTKDAAMKIKYAQKCIDRGAKIVDEVYKTGCNIIGVKGIGSGTTISAAALMHSFTKTDIRICVACAKGSYKDISTEINIVKQGIYRNTNCNTTIKKMAAFGSFEIIQMIGAILRSAELRMIIMVDGFVSAVALLIANQINSNCSALAFSSYLREEDKLPLNGMPVMYIKADAMKVESVYRTIASSIPSSNNLLDNTI